MSFRIAAAWAVAVAACAGCTPTDRKALPPLEALAAEKWRPIGTTHLQARVAGLGLVPNNGLQLPAVSADGEWIAYLQVGREQEVFADALITGKGLKPVSLFVRSLRAEAPEQVICRSGACWPAWLPDSHRIAFIAYEPDGRCKLGLHDLRTGQTRYTRPGLDHMIMLAVCPGGTHLAVVAFPQQPDDARLFLIGVPGGSAEPVPVEGDTQQALWPHWIDDRTLVYLARQDGGDYLYKWTVGAARPQRLCRLNAPKRTRQALVIFSGLARPVSPDGRRLAHYDFAADRIVLVDLADGTRQAMHGETRAGCWFGPEAFASATDKDLRLESAVNDQRRGLMRGPWLPRWANAETRRLVLCTRGPEPWVFKLVRVQLMPGR